MTFTELRTLIKEQSKNVENSFESSGNLIMDTVFKLERNTVINLITDIGTIPEDIEHDSSEEKLYSKVTDILLAKTFHELGIHATVNKERSNCADIIARSSIYGYSLIGDAKAFRLSRTAKNQKDFKVKSMADWRGEHNYAILVCPFYQYPKISSQIYGQALDSNICLLSWEHLALFLGLGIYESVDRNLAQLWNISARLAQSITVEGKNLNFHDKANLLICNDLNIDMEILQKYFGKYRLGIIRRGETEVKFWKNRINEIKHYTKEHAINELITALKLKEKIVVIERFIKSLYS